MVHHKLKSGLILAVEHGDPQIVKQHLNIIDPNTRERLRGRSALHLAVRKDDFEIARILLDHGADVNAVSDDLLTPLHIAVGNQSALMVRLLLFFKANANPPKNLVGKTLLYMAVEYDCLEIIEMLLRAGASIQDAKTPSTTVFDVATRKNNNQILSLLFYFKKMQEISKDTDYLTHQEALVQTKWADSREAAEGDNLYLERLRSEEFATMRGNLIVKSLLARPNYITSF